MRRRPGFSLVEAALVIFVIAGLLAMLSPAIAEVQAITLRIQSADNLKRIMIGMHRYADDHSAYLPGFRRNPSDLELFYSVLPYLDAGFCDKLNENNARYEMRQVVRMLEFKMFVDPADWSVAHEHYRATRAGKPDLEMLQQGKWQVPSEYYGGLTSYAANGQVFEVPIRIPAGFGDGTTNTIAFGQHYPVIRRMFRFPANPARDVEMTHYSVWEDTRKAGMSIRAVWGTNAQYRTRCSSFANHRPDEKYNADFDDVYPVTTNHVTTGSIPDLHFQANPRMEDADPRICQSPHNGGMLVAMADASVRFMDVSIKSNVYWSLATPNGGEKIDDDWLTFSREIRSQPSMPAVGRVGKLVFGERKEPSLFEAVKLNVAYSVNGAIKNHQITDQKQIREILATMEIKQPEIGLKLGSKFSGQMCLEFPGNKFTTYIFVQKDKLQRTSSAFDGPEGYSLRNTKLYEKLCQVCSELEGRPIDMLKEN